MIERILLLIFLHNKQKFHFICKKFFKKLKFDYITTFFKYN